MTDKEIQETVKQAAEQAAQQAAQAVSQAIQKLLQTTGQATTGAGVFTREELGDIGGTEGIESDLITNRGILFSNQKRTFDEYQHESLESIRRNRTYVDKVIADSHGYDMGARNIANQALQNAVETANMVGKQAVRHGDVAIDRQWNVNETDYAAASIINAMNAPAVKEAMSAAIAQILAAMAAEKKTT